MILLKSEVCLKESQSAVMSTSITVIAARNSRHGDRAFLPRWAAPGDQKGPQFMASCGLETIAVRRDLGGFSRWSFPGKEEAVY